MSRPAIVIAAAYVGLQMATSGRYGYFRDELYYLACGDHLAWGYVDHPPVVALVARVSRALFGESLLAIRLLSAVAGGATILLTGRLVRVFGGDAWAEAVAALGVVIAPIFLFLFHILSMNAWDVLLWTAVALTVARIFAEERPSLWVAAGVLIGVGVETKHSMAFFVLGLATGMLLTPARRWLADRFLWSGAAIAAIIVAPHVWWQAAHGWPTLEFARNATAHKNEALSPLAFLVEQILQMHPVNVLLLGAGLWFLATARGGRFRPFAWAYLAVFALLVAQRGKPYYISPIYPLMFAAGAAAIGAATARRTRWIRPAMLAAMLVFGAATAPFTLPILPVDLYIRYAAAIGLKPSSGERQRLGVLPQHYADMFGWDEIVSRVARVYHALPPDEQRSVGIVALNYGDAGAVDLLGPRYGLPLKAISPHNNYWYWGLRGASGEVLIVIGGNVRDHRQSYADVREVDRIACGYCMPYENNQPIFILRKPIRSIDEIWRTSRFFI